MVATDRDFLFLKIISLLKYIFIICACKASSVEIGSVVTLQYKNNIFQIFKTAISRNYGN